MNKMRSLISALLGLVVLAALATGLVWLLGPQGALPGQQVLPTQRVSPLRTPTPGPVETPTPEVIILITPHPTYVPPPTPTPRPWPTGTPFPIPGPAEDPSGTILYMTHIDLEAWHRQCTVHAIRVDETGQPTGEPRVLASLEDCSEPFASPDGRYLAVPQATSTGLSRPLILDLESGKVWPVFDPEVWPEGWIEGRFHGWHPDSRHILYYNEFTLDSGLWLVDIYTGEYSVLAGELISGGAAVSPDGTRVVYGGGGEAWVVSLDGARRERLDAPIGYIRGWSPDGNWILSTGGGVRAANVLDGQHVQLDPDVAGRKEGSSPPVPGNVIPANMLAAWSPGGRTVAVTHVLVPKGAGADFDPFEAGNIYLMDAVGGRKWLLLSEGTGLSAAWSPDGSMLAFLSKRSGSTEVWVANADGTGLRQLTHEGPTRQFVVYYAPIWISSGR